MTTTTKPADLEVPAYIAEARRLLEDASIASAGASLTIPIRLQDIYAISAPASMHTTPSGLVVGGAEPAPHVEQPAALIEVPKYEIHTPRIIKRRGLTDTKDERGPQQLAIEQQSGRYLDESIWDDFEVDPLGRDKFTVNERREEWLRTEELYYENRDAPLFVDADDLRLPKYGIHLVGGEMGEGKCTAFNTPILMYDGTVKMVQDVIRGDLLMGPDSKARTVLSTTKGRGPMYRTNPTKGDSWGCNDVHMLTLVKTNSGPSRPTEHQRDGEIIDVPLNEWLEWTPARKMLYKLFRVGVDFPWQPSLPVEPYLVGILIGDGSLINTVTISTPDAEIVEYCQGAADRWSCTLNERATQSLRCPAYSFSRGPGRQSNPLKDALRRIDVFGHKSPDKFIPQQYLTASREDRLELLAGLVDTDGHLLHSGFEFTQASERLSDDIAFLARSLGLSAYRSTKPVKYKGEWRDYYKVKIHGHTDMVPTKIPRKQAEPRQQKKDVLRTAFTAEPIGEDDYYGFTLDGDGRFLLGDFTVTHNTLWASYVARHFRRRGWNVFSTAGLLLGQRLDIRESYAFPDHVTQGCFIFVDEVHTFVDRYSANSIRSRTFGQSSTAMRKEQVTCFGASAHTIMVGWEYKGVTECVMIPQRWYPRGKLHAPPFCHISINKMFPFPYQRKDQLLLDAGLVKGTDQKLAKWRPEPQELMGAAKLMDSFESVTLGENFDVNAASMKEMREGKGGGDAGPDLVVVVKRVWEANYIAEGEPVHFSTIREILKQNRLVVTNVQIRSALAAVGIPVKHETINEADLREYFTTEDGKRV